MAAVLDGHDEYGLNAAGAGLIDSNWNGAQVFTSRDDATFVSAGVINTASTIGVATTALADWTGGQMMDDVSTLDISVNDGGSLSSVTHDEAVEGGNIFALWGADGWEIGTFATATSLGGGQYRLSKIERGLAGTEHTTGGHAVGDRFVLLDANAQIRLTASSADLSRVLYARGVSFGLSLQATPSKSVDFVAESLKPRAPVELFAWPVPDSSDIGLRWVRRARIDGEWSDQIDVPLDEDTEAYEVDILDPDTQEVLRTIEVEGDTETTWTLAQQISDFGEAQDEVRFQVRQMSARVGAGHNATGATFGIVPSPFSPSWGSSASLLASGTISGAANEIATQSLGVVDMIVMSASPLPLSGKWYWEIQCDQATAQLQDIIGIGWDVAYLQSSTAFGESGHSTIHWITSPTTTIGTAGGTQFSGPVRLSFAYDVPNALVWVAVNGTYLLSGNPATAANPYFSNIAPSPDQSTQPTRIWARGAGDGVISVIKLYVRASDFSYSVPSGFSPLSSEP
jgi:hypothetical protein